MRMLTAAFALLAALATAAPASQAAPLAGPDLASLMPGSELRGEFVNDGRFESHVWRFSPDGSVSAVSLRYSHGNFRSNNEDRSDFGRWWVSGGRLCVQYGTLFHGAPNCFIVDVGPAQSVRLIGYPTMTGTLSTPAIRSR